MVDASLTVISSSRSSDLRDRQSPVYTSRRGVAGPDQGQPTDEGQGAADRVKALITAGYSPENPPVVDDEWSRDAVSRAIDSFCVAVGNLVHQVPRDRVAINHASASMQNMLNNVRRHFSLPPRCSGRASDDGGGSTQRRQTAANTRPSEDVNIGERETQVENPLENPLENPPKNQPENQTRRNGDKEQHDHCGSSDSVGEPGRLRRSPRKTTQPQRPRGEKGQGSREGTNWTDNNSVRAFSDDVDTLLRPPTDRYPHSANPVSDAKFDLLRGLLGIRAVGRKNGQAGTRLCLKPDVAGDVFKLFIHKIFGPAGAERMQKYTLAVRQERSLSLADERIEWGGDKDMPEPFRNICRLWAECRTIDPSTCHVVREVQHVILLRDLRTDYYHYRGLLENSDGNSPERQAFSAYLDKKGFPAVTGRTRVAQLNKLMAQVLHTTHDRVAREIHKATVIHELHRRFGNAILVLLPPQWSILVDKVPRQLLRGVLNLIPLYFPQTQEVCRSLLNDMIQPLLSGKDVTFKGFIAQPGRKATWESILAGIENDKELAARVDHPDKAEKQIVDLKQLTGEVVLDRDLFPPGYSGWREDDNQAANNADDADEAYED